MGYYSEVGIAMKKADYEKLKRKINTLPKERNSLKEAVKHLLTNADCIDPYINLKEYAGKFVAMHWETVKWYMYDDMPEIDFLMEYIRTLPDYSYMRIGEETGDIEEEHEGDYNLDVFSAETKMVIPNY